MKILVSKLLIESKMVACARYTEFGEESEEA
jgi:hypothetical protein